MGKVVNGIIAVSSAAILAGCTTGSTSRMMTYKFPVHHVKMVDDTYRVYEHKTEESLMVAPSLGTTMAAGATLGMSTLPPEQRMEAAARQYLANTGRANCKITSGHLLTRPLYEFRFKC